MFELAVSPDHHPTSAMIVQVEIFFHLEMLVNLNQYRTAIGVFNNHNIVSNNVFSISRKVIVV